jgi:hypothetical protein
MLEDAIETRSLPVKNKKAIDRTTADNGGVVGEDVTGH